jgi:hypothetical protein
MAARLFVIWSIEHEAWWAPDECGYTPVLAEAGLYTDVDSARILARANLLAFNECRIPIHRLLGTLPSIYSLAGFLS